MPDHHWLSHAQLAAGRSKDPSTQVGCAIVKDGKLASTGYNGFPRGVHDCPNALADRDRKYEMVVHAEANALLQAGLQAEGGTAYVTAPPCSRCAGLLINAGIARVVWIAPPAGLAERFRASFYLGQDMFRQAGVEVLEMENETCP